VKVPAVPATNVALAVLVKALGIPMPETEINCEPLDALSAIVTEAERVPGAVGVKVTAIEQDAPAFTVALQLFVCEKSPGLVPDNAMFVIPSGALPVSVNVTVCDALCVPTF
jgi:hypothetical protein